MEVGHGLEMLQFRAARPQLGRMHFPMGKRPLERPQPFLNASLARIDLLASTHQADDRAPIYVTIHDAEQELGLRHRKSGLPTLLLHELRSLIDVPRTLSLIEYGDFFIRGGVRGERIIPEMMDVLDEGRCATVFLGFGGDPASFTLPFDSVER